MELVERRMMAYHCDREGCDTWTREGSIASAHWLTLRSGKQVWHFCTEDCLMHWASAKSVPTEVVSL